MEAETPCANVERELRDHYAYLPKDYVETASGMLLAVVAPGVTRGRVMAWLRYAIRGDGLCKLGTKEANDAIVSVNPDWLYHCPQRDAILHAVPVEAIRRHWQPSQYFPTYRSPHLRASPQSAALDRILQLLRGNEKSLPAIIGQLGVTGSSLLGIRHAASDIDLIVYGIDNFLAFRRQIQHWIKHRLVESLSIQDWEATHERRGCELSFEEYCWHEVRKLNKFMVTGVRVDVSCVDRPHPRTLSPGRKLERIETKARITDARYAYGSPALYGINCQSKAYRDVTTLVSHTPTYAGQAEVGERVWISGWLEQCNDFQRIVVGTSREAAGEFTKVVNAG